VVLVHQPVERDAGYSQFSRGPRNIFVVTLKGCLNGLLFDLLYDLLQREDGPTTGWLKLKMGKRDRGHSAQILIAKLRAIKHSRLKLTSSLRSVAPLCNRNARKSEVA